MFNENIREGSMIIKPSNKDEGVDFLTWIPLNQTTELEKRSTSVGMNGSSDVFGFDVLRSRCTDHKVGRSLTQVPWLES